MSDAVVNAAALDRLDTYDENEWFEVVRKLKPGLTRDAFEQMMVGRDAHMERRPDPRVLH